MSLQHFTYRVSRVLITPLALSGLLAGCGGGGGDGDGLGAGGDADLRGTISIEPGSRVDSDYADLWAVGGRGGDSTVPLPVPATVGGYLSAGSGAYPNGFKYPTDSRDTYTAPLEEGDNLYLQVFPSGDGDIASSDVTVALDGNELCTGAACGQGELTRLSVGSLADGNSTIEISVSGGGPLRYVLTLAPQGALSDTLVSWPEPELVVDEAVVTGVPSSLSTMSSSGLRASSAMDVVRSIGPDTYHIRRSNGSSIMSLASIPDSDPRAATVEWIRGLKEEFGLLAEPNYIFRLQSDTPTSNPDYADTNDRWNLDAINAQMAWQATGASWGENVGVAVLDTGMFSTNPGSFGGWHEDLVGNVVGGTTNTLDFVSPDYDVDGTAGRDVNPATPVTPAAPEDTSFHGTHVAGIIAAQDNGVGTLGIAHEATIYPYRVLGVDSLTGEDGSGAASDLIAAINHAAVQPEVDVINLSLGGLPFLKGLQQATDLATDQGKLVVAAAGNNGNSSAVYPAANRRVVGVGASNRDGLLASYSNFGPSVDLVAPGGDLSGATEGIINAYGLVNGDATGGFNLEADYAYLSGTSMAAPHVAGVYALMKGHNPNLTPDQFRARVLAGEVTNPGAMADYSLASHGAGLLDALAAVQDATAYPTVVSAYPRVLYLDASAGTAPVELETLSSAPFNPQLVTGPVLPGWLTVTGGDGDPLVAGQPLPESLLVTVEGVAAGDRAVQHTVTLTYSTDSGSRDLEIPVFVQPEDEAAARNAGRHYVLLVETDDPRAGAAYQVLASFSNGQYSFSFGDVEPGNYYLVAGTDLDNNGFVCENGEACAEYPEVGDRKAISVGGGSAQVRNMTTSFRRPTVTEMGLPRYDFEGYRIQEASGDEPTRQIR